MDVMQKLGLSSNDRALVIHADDIGMCRATVEAFERLREVGLVTCGSTMVPCSWFPALAAYGRAHPEADIGVHVTLTCEWDVYRWSPLTRCLAGVGLADEDGYMHRTSKAVREGANLGTVRTEVYTQVDRALEAGLDITHIDDHMVTLRQHPPFMEIYIDLIADYHLPVYLRRRTAAQYVEMGYGPEDAEKLAAATHRAESAGVPLFDGGSGGPLVEAHADRVEQLKPRLAELPAGLSIFVIHPAVDGPEIRAIADTAAARVGDFDAFMSDAMGQFIEAEGFHLIGYRQLRELMHG